MRNEQVIISAIVPTIDFNEYLDDSVQSILDDDANGIEIIVVFDGGLPANFIRIGPLADERVTVLSTGKRLGSAAAINIGIENARGKYIARLDADDLSLPGRLRLQASFLEENPQVLLVGTHASLIDAVGRNIGDLRPTSTELRRVMLSKNPFIHSSVMFRTQIIRDMGGYDLNCIRMQDYELFLRIAVIGEVAILPILGVAYRIHEGQNSKDLSRFMTLMLTLSKQRRLLAKSLGSPVGVQLVRDLIFMGAQILRYKGLRAPRYTAGIVGVENSNAHKL